MKYFSIKQYLRSVYILDISGLVWRDKCQSSDKYSRALKNGSEWPQVIMGDCETSWLLDISWFFNIEITKPRDLAN